MVNEGKESQDYAQYLLDEIRALAANQRVDYASTRVTQDVANLGYSLQEVCRCLESLQPQHFSHSERYSDTSRFWNDVYLCFWGAGTSDPDRLYIKLRLKTSATGILLISFHLER